eukprot:768511-Hanusia_phi.AAC.7
METCLDLHGLVIESMLQSSNPVSRSVSGKVRGVTSKFQGYRPYRPGRGKPLAGRTHPPDHQRPFEHDSH